MSDAYLNKRYEEFVSEHRGWIRYLINNKKHNRQPRPDLSFTRNSTASFLAAISAFGGTAYFIRHFFIIGEIWTAILLIGMLMVYIWYALTSTISDTSESIIANYFFEYYNCRWGIVRSYIEEKRNDELFDIKMPSIKRLTLENFEVQKRLILEAQQKANDCNEIYDYILRKAENDTWWHKGVL